MVVSKSAIVKVAGASYTGLHVPAARTVSLWLIIIVIVISALPGEGSRDQEWVSSIWKQRIQWFVSGCVEELGDDSVAGPDSSAHAVIVVIDCCSFASFARLEGMKRMV